MTPREFVIWLQGFVAATHEYSMTPKQWEFFKEKLESVVLDQGNSYNMLTLTSGSIPTVTYTASTDKTLLKD
jgi:hypothetical protein